MEGARDLEQAKSIFALQLRRGQGCAAARGIAQLKISRAPYVVGARDPAGVPPARGGSFDPRSHANFAQAESSGEWRLAPPTRCSWWKGLRRWL